MSDSTIISKLIFLAFAAPEVRFWEGDDPILTWDEVMGVYARAVRRETPATPTPEPEPEPDEMPEELPIPPGLILDPEPIYEDKPSPLDGAVLLREHPVPSKPPEPPKFRGADAGLKLETFNRLQDFRKAGGLGCYAELAKHSNNTVSEWIIRDAAEGKPVKAIYWSAIKTALDRAGDAKC